MIGTFDVLSHYVYVSKEYPNMKQQEITNLFEDLGHGRFINLDELLHH